jgi:hypothetical protein
VCWLPAFVYADDRLTGSTTVGGEGSRGFGERAHRGIVQSMIQSLRHRRVMVAKAVTAFTAGLGFGAVGAVAANAVGFGFIAAHGYHVALPGATIARYDLGAMLGAALMAAVGVAVGTLVRSQIIAVVIVLIWGLALEAILAGVLKAVGPYLPYTACMTLASSHPGGGVLGYATRSHTAPLPYLAAVGLVAGVATIIGLIAARTSLRQDIT